MCGLIGVVGAAPPPALQRALDSLRHRGPDGSGLHVHGSVTLGHRRLAVIDLTGGAQPMRDPATGVAIVFNGEIYNHLDLRTDLVRGGRIFKTTSDTETLLALYLEHGEACPPMLRGMYAFVVHDPRSGTLFGARDPFGKKPLYWSAPRGTIRFAIASEPRALLALHEEGPWRPSMEGIQSYLRHDYVTGTNSAFDGIRQFLPGHAFSFDASPAAAAAPRQWEFWSPKIRSGRAVVREDAAVDEFRRLMLQAVDRRLLADVPVGILLSGGIDSSLIAALVARLRGRGSIPSFSIGFDDRRFDESAYAAEVARHVGTTHFVRTFGPDDCIEAITTVIRHMDEPFADPSILPTAMLSRFAREHVTVALGGDGGDELFAGYDTFKAQPAAAALRSLLPGAFDRAADRLAGLGGADSAVTHMPIEFKVRRFLRGYRFRGEEMLAAWHSPFDEAGLRRLLPGVATAGTRAATRVLPQHDEGVAMLRWYQTVYLPYDILVKGDRASMLASLEVRCPFLDVELAEFVNDLPFEMKYRRGVRKYLLRQAMQAWAREGMTLPAAVHNRPKKGFGVPIASWLRGPLAERARVTLLERWPVSLEFVSANERKALLADHMSNRRNLWKEIWSLLVLAWWADKWVT